MKKMVLCEVASCDVCGDKNQVYYHCAGCGKDFCWTHKKNIVEYHQRIGVSGYGDIILCKKCDATPPERLIPLLMAYKEVARLRIESDIFYDDFKNRQKVAEALAEEWFRALETDKVTL